MFTGEYWREIVGHPEGGTRLLLTIDGGGVIISGEEIEYHGDLQKALLILFGEGEFQDRPVLATLRMLSQNVTGAIKGLAELHSSAART